MTIELTNAQLIIAIMGGVLTIGGTILAVGRVWGSLKTHIEKLIGEVGEIKATLENEIRPDLKDVRERFGIVEDRVSTLWKDKFAPASSPRQLNDLGHRILEESGVKEIIDEKKHILLEKVKAKAPETAYDAETEILETVMDLPEHCPDVTERLKEGAFKVGQTIDAVLFVASVYFRDSVFEELGFTLDDIDGDSETTDTV